MSLSLMSSAPLIQLRVWGEALSAENQELKLAIHPAQRAQDRSASAERFTPQYNTEQAPLNGFYQTITLLSPGSGQPSWQSRPSL